MSRLQGYHVPKWLLAVLLLAAGAGSALGPVLASRFNGAATISAIGSLSYGSIMVGDNTTLFNMLPGSTLTAPPPGARAYVSLSSDRTDFTASVDLLPNGSRYDLAIPISNSANTPARTQLILDIPDELQVDVEQLGPFNYAQDTSGLLRVGRINRNTWEFTAAPNSAGEETGQPPRLLNGLVIHVGMPVSAPPGFYTLRARFQRLG